MRTNILRIFALLLALALVVAGCGGGSDEAAEGEGASPDAQTADGDLPSSVTLSIGEGLAYAPLTIIRAEGLLEERFPDTAISWQTVTGGAATREGVLAGEIHVGVAGMAPFLLGWGRDVGWKMLGSLGHLDYWLVAIDDEIQTLQDLNESGGQISMPSPDSGQAIALYKAAQDQLDNADAFDQQVVSLGHPEAVQALISGQTQAAYSSPPFEYQLVDEHGGRRISSGYEAFGLDSMTFSGLVMLTDFYDRYPSFAQGVFEALEEAQTMLRDEPEGAAEILAEAAGGEVSAEQYVEWMQSGDTVWTTELAGLLENGAFMAEIGMIEEAPESLSEIGFPTVTGGQ